MREVDFGRRQRVWSELLVSMVIRTQYGSTHGTGVSTGPPFALSSARFFLSFASSMH